MSEQSVLAIYENQDHAEQAVVALRRAGVTERCISVVTQVSQLPPPPPKEQEDLATDASLGAAANKTVGFLAGAVFLTATGLAPLAIAGAMAAAIGGAATGSLVGLLSGYTVTKEQAKSYEQMVRSGHVLVFVHGDPLQVAQAETIFETTPPHLLHLHSDAEDVGT